MGPAIIAALAALAGSATTGLVQHWTTTRVRRRQQLVSACTALIGALIADRGRRYMKVRFGREGWPDTPETVEARYGTHGAVTTAMAAVRMATRDARLLALASEAIDSTFAIGAVSEGELPAARARSLAAHEALLDAAAKAVA